MSSPRGSMYWCHECRRGIVLASRGSMICPRCGGDFVEEIMDAFEDPMVGFPGFEHFGMDSFRFGRFDERERWGRSRGRQPPAWQLMEAMNALLRRFQEPGSRDIEFHSRNGAGPGRGRMPLNPMVLLRGVAPRLIVEDGNVELLFDDGLGMGFGRFPVTMGDHGLRVGLEELIEQLTQQDGGRCGPPPAARSAVDAMPTLRIAAKHMSSNSHCAVCTDRFEIGGEAREMPCKHIYHSDCILPWLAQHNSCPVCRHELPTDDRDYDQGRARAINALPSTTSPSSTRQEGAGASGGRVGLTVLGLTGGGFAVGGYSSVDRNEPSTSRGTGSGPGSSRNSSNGGENQGRRHPLSFLWPFRSSNSNSQSHSSRGTSSGSSNDRSGTRHSGWPDVDNNGPSRWFS